MKASAMDYYIVDTFTDKLFSGNPACKCVLEKENYLMIEVLFGDSEAACMKAAKNKIVLGKADGPTSVWIAGKKKPPKREKCGWVEGTSAEVICLGFMLDIGNIKENIDSVYRKKLIYSMLSNGQWEADEEINEELLRTGDCYLKELSRLKKCLDDGEPIRIWYSNAPYSICGFYHLCSILQKYENEIYVVPLPEYQKQTDSIVLHSNWGEVSAEEFAGFLYNEKILSMEEIRMYAMMWDGLKKDNSPLRAVINGKLMGVPENFYDFLIWKRITTEPTKEARIIGDILGKNQIGMGDWWYANRIDYYIGQGRIKVMEDDRNKYARTICLP